jgi:hypothetical protein
MGILSTTVQEDELGFRRPPPKALTRCPSPTATLIRSTAGGPGQGSPASSLFCLKRENSS